MIITSKGPQNIDQVQRHFLHQNLFLSPVEYQREGVWKPEQKRLLIDTIFRGMDIPKFYLWKVDRNTLFDGYPAGETRNLYKVILERRAADNDDPNPYLFEVVDGQQRIRTILEYIGTEPPSTDVYRGRWEPPFPALDHTPMARGKLFSQLNVDQQIQFGEAPLTVMILEQATIDEIRDMFLRLQNGTPLNAQQKRDAMGSDMGRVARELSGMPFFTVAVDFDNTNSSHHLVASQMLHLERRGDIVSCTSQQLDKVYEIYRGVQLEPHIVTKASVVSRQ